MGLMFAFIAAILAAITNLLLRMSIQAGGNSQGYLSIQLLVSCGMMVLLNPVRMQDFACCPSALAVGIVGGVILGLFFWALGKSLETGPAGLSISVLNASAVMPALLLSLIFGIAFGHFLTLFHISGFFVLAYGIFWAGFTSARNPHWKRWVVFVILMFVLHSLFLTFLQWWAMLINPMLPPHLFLPFHITSPHIHWFMPALFFMAGLVQWVIFFFHHKRWPIKQEIGYGILGGMLNGLCSFFLILAPQIASPWENAFIFPIFTVGILLVCNLWAQGLYAEKVNWKAAAVCVIGLLIGTLGLLT